MSVTLVLGGARSGKSRQAEALAAAHAGVKYYIATAEPFDDEMRERILLHRSQRGAGWETVEAPLDLVSAVESLGRGVVLIDCLTVWIGNLMHAGRAVAPEVEKLVAALTLSEAEIIVVSNEVGLSIVPETALGRRFRDEQGRANQAVAAVADEVILVVAGLPLTLKPRPPQR